MQAVKAVFFNTGNLTRDFPWSQRAASKMFDQTDKVLIPIQKDISSE